ncbi:hypothetical protein D3C87_1942160 [compost metagenome]
MIKVVHCQGLSRGPPIVRALEVDLVLLAAAIARGRIAEAPGHAQAAVVDVLGVGNPVRTAANFALAS